ncbi:MAG: hypothetical protein HC826_01045 [Rhodospirillales bacterium]|nr:hypothetical protein [Rhodospirillales bacterium]
MKRGAGPNRALKRSDYGPLIETTIWETTMDYHDSRREPELDYLHRGCGAVVSIGAYGDWHLCEACEVTPHRPHHHRLHAVSAAKAS